MKSNRWDGRGNNTLARIINLLRYSHLAQRWGPVLFWMAGIFYFSSRATLPPPFSSPRYGTFFHGAAHFGEYAILATLLYLALVKQCQPEGAKANPGESEFLRPRDDRPMEHRPFTLSFLIALLFALLDELHQGFVPGREAELADLALDAVGMSVALIVIACLGQGGMVLPSREGRGSG